jgi:hypothetical protein
MRAPVGIAVPWYVPDFLPDGRGAIVVDGIFGSYARKAFARAQAGEVYLSPWWTNCDEREKNGKYYITTATITTADLVASPRDKRAVLTSVVPFEGMTGAQVEVQRRFDRYMEAEQPVCVDYLAAVERLGREALEPLWDLVDPIRAEYLTSGRTAERRG